jgi:hypothetical protein
LEIFFVQLIESKTLKILGSAGWCSFSMSSEGVSSMEERKKDKKKKKFLRKSL